MLWVSIGAFLAALSSFVIGGSLTLGLHLPTNLWWYALILPILFSLLGAFSLLRWINA